MNLDEKDVKCVYERVEMVLREKKHEQRDQGYLYEKPESGA